MPRPCLVCSNSRRLAKTVELVAAGQSDRAIAQALNAFDPTAPPMSAMAVSRHRRNHLVAPAKALVEAAGKGQAAAEQRAQVMAAAEAGDPSAFVALAGIVNDLRKVHERLERTASAAEQDGQRMAVAGLSAQQLRAAEVRAKIGGVGAYAPSRVGGEGASTPPFSINFFFSGRQTERITLASDPVQHRIIDGVADGEDTSLLPTGR